jgi:cell division protein ZapA (FtsZ GTPase activity inhibitor)
MSEVNIKIDGRDYVVLSPDGEETHVLALADKLSNLAVKLRAGVTNVADSQVLMLAGLTLLGDLEDAETKVKEAEAKLADAEAKASGAEAQTITLQGAIEQMKNDALAQDELLANEVANLSQKLLAAQTKTEPVTASQPSAAGEPEIAPSDGEPTLS